jgi:hypothetical protein
MKTLFEHDKAVISYDPSSKSIDLIWKKVQDEATYKLMYAKGIEFMKEYNVTNWFSDIRHQGVVGPSASKWLQEVIIPKAVGAGLKKIAVVMDADVFQKFYIDNINKKSASQLVRNFKSKEEAKAWLSEN